MYKLSRTKSKKGFKSFISLLLVAAIVITGALAYLTATDSKTNTFTVGNVAIELTEPNWVDANGLNIVPGETIAKDPTIKNTGRNDAYVYAMITIPKADGVDVNENGTVTAQDDYQLFTYEVNEGWTLIDSKIDSGDANNYYLYAYNTALTPDQSTPAVFDEVTFGNITEGQIASDEEINILVDAYAIQSDYYNGEATDAESAWTLYANQNGWAFPSVAAPITVPEGYSALNFVDEDGDVVHTEVAEVGTPVDMYFESSLAKDGYTFDWVDETTNEVAYSGMAMPEEETNLVANYTETGLGTANVGAQKFTLKGNATDGYTATFLAENGQSETWVVPNYITVTGDGTKDSSDSFKYGLETDAYMIFLGANLEYPNGTYVVPVTGIDTDDQPSTRVKNIVIADSVKKVDLGSTYNVENLILPYGVEEMESYHGTTTSDNKFLLKSVQIPASMTSLPDQAFAYCDYLEEIYIPGSIKTIPEKAFYSCGGLKKITIGEGVETIEGMAFYKKTGETMFVEEVTLPSTLKTISSTAFPITTSTTDCSIDVLNVNCVDLDADAYGAFAGNCNTINFGDQVKYIRKIYGQTLITELYLPDSVVSVDKYAFKSCPYLTTISAPSTCVFATDSVPATCEIIYR